MWESGILGDSSPEYYKAKFSNFSVHQTNDGFKYMNLTREIPKCIQENLLHVATSCLRCGAPQTTLIDAP